MKKIGICFGVVMLGQLAAGSVLALGDREMQLRNYHESCDHGDRRSCVKFGMYLEENKIQMAVWRREHPEWFWYDR